MAAPQPAAMLPQEIKHSTVELPQKPGAQIAYSCFKDKEQPDAQKTVIVFLNGLMTDKSTWLPVMAGIIRQRKDTAAGVPSMLAYDRYGQGLTESRDPQDQGGEQGHGHDCADAAADLHQLLQVLNPNPHHLILVGNSIGCAIARLYASKYPVSAVLMLDSVMANSNFDLFPNPDAADFDKGQLPEDVTLEVLKVQRAKTLAIFSPGTPNKEGLSRRNLPTLLPQSDGPPLKGQGRQPWVTVVGHDFDTFAEESLRSMGAPKSLTMQYTNPTWHAFNEGLAKLTDPKFSKGPIQAKGCGHFIQRDDPNFVVDELKDLVDKVRMEESAAW